MTDGPAAAPTPEHRSALLLAARLAGWAARPLDPQTLTVEQADAISEAAANAVLDRLAEWEMQASDNESNSPTPTKG